MVFSALAAWGNQVAREAVRPLRFPLSGIAASANGCRVPMIRQRGARGVRVRRIRLTEFVARDGAEFIDYTAGLLRDSRGTESTTYKWC